MITNNYDLVILGGGSAGYAAARTGVRNGLRTAVIDGSATLGGLCILRGCIAEQNPHRDCQSKPHLETSR